VLRWGGQDDAAVIRDLSARVFGHFGDYGAFLPRYLDDPWVKTIVAESDGVVAGFVMVGLTASPRLGGELVADLLAIAVAPGRQGQGLGTVLLEQALVVAAGLGQRYGLRAIELSVADTNPGAQRFFTRHGFVVVTPTDGYYPAGQVAIRMSRSLEARAGRAVPGGRR
jgi:ribosomal protein S18 acetylase RimI-like enzyme